MGMHENGIVLVNVAYNDLKRNDITQLNVEDRGYKVVLDVDNAFEDDKVRLYNDSDLAVKLLIDENTQVTPFYEMLDLKDGALGFDGFLSLEWEIIDGRYEELGFGGKIAEMRTKAIVDKMTYGDIKLRSFHFSLKDDLVVVNVTY